MALSIFVAGSASAQLTVIEGLVKNVTDIGIYSHAGWPKKHSEVGASRGYWTGFGIEATYEIFAKPRVKDGAIRTTLKDLERVLKAYQAVTDRHVADSVSDWAKGVRAQIEAAIKDPSRRVQLATPGQTTKATPIEQTVEVRNGDTTITTKSALVVVPVGLPVDTSWRVEFGLAYTQMQTFRDQLSPSGPDQAAGEVRGAIREFPSVSVYVTWETAFEHFWIPFRFLAPYAGLRSGLVQLSNLRAYAPNPPLAAGQPAGNLVLKGDGSTFQGAAIAGTGFDIGPNAHIFVEGAHTWRTVASVDWSGAPTTALYPPSLPRSLDLSTWSIAVGAQVHIAR